MEKHTKCQVSIKCISRCLYFILNGDKSFSMKAVTDHIFQPGMRNWFTSMIRPEIKLFNSQAWVRVGRYNKCINERNDIGNESYTELRP